MRVTIFGTGYVGLVTGACLASLGHDVACVDVQVDRIELVKRAKSPFHEPGLGEILRKGLDEGRLRPTTDFQQAMSGSEFSIIAVGTPPGQGGADLSFVEVAAAQIGQSLGQASEYHVVVVKSTVPPGTSDTMVRRILEEQSGRRVGEFGLCMCPEFLREGSAVDDFMHPDRIVIGRWDERSGRALAGLFGVFDCPVVQTSLRNAEMIKYTSNALLSVLISFSNEIASLCEATPDTDVETVMDALHLDRRLSPLVNGQRVTPGLLSYLRAGAGFGGSCLPKDTSALRSFAAACQVETSLLDAAVRVNLRRPAQLAEMADGALGGLAGRTVAVLGLAFKPGTDDLRDSPSLAIMRHLLERGARVKAYDPVVLGKAELAADPRVVLCHTPETVLADVDAALIATAWPEFAEWNWDALCKLMRRPVILDGRSALRHVALPVDASYWCVGRCGPKTPA
ncbi:MAG: UDP-glucose/GDP-mannose dehydrogenase family protein [Chloroflexi bacterium]|nr:UDP-glucose/GDP-mannose dehydrogenase family protein [Chloroflexota bacterium]